MDSFYFLRVLNDELKQCIEDLTHGANVFIKDIHIQEEKTLIKYEVLNEDGFKTFSIELVNKKSKE